MKRTLLLILILSLSLAGFAQNQARRPQAGASLGYQAVTHTEVMPEPAYYAPPAKGASITDPQFGTTIWRLTDGDTDAVGGNGSYHTTSSASNIVWNKTSTRCYITSGGGAVMPYAIAATGEPTRIGTTLSFQGEPIFSFTNPDILYGISTSAADQHTIKQYNFGNSTYTDILDLDELGFPLVSGSTVFEGQYVGFISNSWPPTERFLVIFGGNQEYIHYLALFDSSFNVIKVYDTLTQTVGTTFDNDVAKTGTVTTNGTTSLVGSGTAFTTELAVGNWIVVNSQARKVSAIADNTHLTVSSAFTGSASGLSISLRTYTMNSWSSSALNGTLRGTVSINGTTTVTGTSTAFNYALDGDGDIFPGQRIQINGEVRTVATTPSDTSLTVTSAFSTTASGQTATSLGCGVHNAILSRSGDYIGLSTGYGTRRDPNGNARVIINISTNAATLVTVRGGGHVALGFNDYVNQEYTNNPLAWYIRSLADLNTTANVVLVNAERCTSGSADCLSVIEDHTSWNNATPGNPRAVPLMGEFRYGSTGGVPVIDPPWDTYDDEIIGVPVNVTRAQSATIQRYGRHMTDARGEAFSVISGGTLSSGATSITVADATDFASSGLLILDTANNTQEFVTYTGKSTNTFTGCTRGAYGSTGASHVNGVHVTQPSSLGFWYTPRAQISPDGKKAIFTSNWKKTLGLEAGGSGNSHYRQDVFLIVLPTTSAPPANVSNLSAGSITDTTAAVTFDTDNPGDSIVEYSTDLSYASSAKAYTLATSHSVSLTGLLPGTTYNIRAKSRARGRAVAVAATTSFTTTGAAAGDFVTDSFTESSDTALASHTGATGATWTVHPSYSAAGTIDAATDRLYPTGSTAYYASGTPPSADYYVQADFRVASTISVNAAICARMSTSADTMYMVRLLNGTDWVVRKLVAGSGTDLATSATNVPTAGQTRTVRLTVSGSNITVTVDGVLDAALSVTDSSITAAGRAGLRFAGASSASTGYHLDNFSAR
jgi:hypothetical protein